MSEGAADGEVVVVCVREVVSPDVVGPPSVGPGDVVTGPPSVGPGDVVGSSPVGSGEVVGSPSVGSGSSGVAPGESGAALNIAGVFKTTAAFNTPSNGRDGTSIINS